MSSPHALSASRPGTDAWRVDQKPETPPKDDTAVQKVGRGWRRAGVGIIVGGLVLATVSVLAICILCTPLGRHISNAGSAGAKLFSHMAAHSNPIMIAGVAGTLLGVLVLTPTGIICIARGRAERRQAERDELAKAE